MNLRKIYCMVLSLSLLLISVPSLAFADPATQTITMEDGSTQTVDLIDQERQDGKLSIFTRNYGGHTQPFSEDTAEVIVANDIVVAKSTAGMNGTYIPSNGYVISGTGSAAAIVNGLQAGDSITTSFPIAYLPDKYFRVNNQVVPITHINASRGAAYVVLYQPSYGPSTNTNPWGMEITVVAGVVTKVVAITQDSSGRWLNNNSKIPSDGYVLSIQSESPFYRQLNGNVRIGDSIELNLSNETLFKAAKTTYNALSPKSLEDNPAAWDDALQQPFPGYRGADQLIVYDSSYGATSGTNPWGYEVVVNQEGKVIQAGGYDSVIPAGGYVVSGHGVQATWLRQQATVGTTFKLIPDKKQVLFMFTPESYLDRVQLGIETAETGLANSRQQFLDVSYGSIEQQINSVKTDLQNFRNQIVAGNYNQFFENFNKLNEEAGKANFMNYESRAVDHRSVWIRPKETNVDQVRQHIAMLRAININSIYLETWWNGYTIFPTDNALTAQNPMYGGFDVLQAYIDESKKAGMEIHAWVEDFLAGVGSVQGPVRTLKPEWSLISRKGYDYHYVPLYSTYYYFLNPMLPEVRDFISGIYKELLQKYDVDGLHLDYIRYPEATLDNDYGYDPYSRNIFMQQYNVDPMDLHPGDPLWDAWVDMRRQTISEFVYRISTEAKTLKPGIRVSASVWPHYDKAPTLMMQEPKDWIAKNHIDQLFPMSYNPDVWNVANDAKNSVEIAGGKALVVIGVGTYNSLSKEMLLNQIKAAMEIGTSGSALFEFESLFEFGYDKAIALGLYSKPAIVPDKDPIVSLGTVISEMERKINTIYVPNGGMSDSKQYLGELDHILNALKDEKLVINRDHEILDKISKLIERLDTDTTVNDEVKKRIKFDLNYFQTILSVFLSKTSK